VAFGGSKLSTIFITTANYPKDEADYLSEKAGAVFMLKQSEFRGAQEFSI